jgi:uncharacterized protein (TIGR00297 family)
MGPISSGAHVAVGIALTLGFAVLARVLRGVTLGGAFAGGVACFLLFVGAGWGAFAALAAVFVLTWIGTRFRYQKKQTRGLAERRGGRSGAQVLANLGVAAGCAVVFAFTRHPAAALACSAALAEAAADTVSSELGQAWSETAWLVTSWQRVAAGTDGGITTVGTLSGVAAAAVVSQIGTLAGLIPSRWIGISVMAAVAGMLVDSLLGAWLERRRWLTNDWVNFLGTLTAAGLAWLAA